MRTHTPAGVGHGSRPGVQAILRRAAAAAAAAVPLLVGAQPHESTVGEYTLRSSTVHSAAIAKQAAREHGLEVGPGRAVLNVVVLRTRADGSRVPVPADVQATATNLAGMQREIPLKPARSPNGDVSYVGMYTFASREVLQLSVRASPQGGSQQLALDYRERMPVR